MRFPKLFIMQAIPCTAHYAACSIECADVNSHCCAGCPQPHAEQMLVNVPGGLAASRLSVSAYFFPQRFGERPTTCSVS